MRCALLLLTLAFLASGARGQTPVRMDATVTQIAGADAYLDRGRDDGLASGDTLRVWREDVFLGRLRVVSAASATAVVTFVAETFAITRGQTLEIEVAAREPEPLAPEAEPPEPARPARTSILDAPVTRGRESDTAPIRVDGRIQFGADALQSTTTFGETETRRQFATPFAALRADVSGLPGGWRASLNGRSQLRTADGAMLGGAPDVWIYAASLDGEIAGAGVRAGRFVPRRERFTGAWDGVDLGIGSDRLGAGVVAGWRPSRAAGLPDGDRAGTVVYVHAQRASGGALLSASSSGGAVWEGETLPFAGGSVSASGTASGVRLRASGDVLADSRPGEAWDLARWSARLSASPLGALTLRAFARQYRPSVVDGASLVLRFAPSRAVGAGATVTLGPALVRADLSLRASGDGGDWSRAWTTGVSVPRLGALPIGLDASATFWNRDGREAIYASGGISAGVGGARGTLAYRLSTSPAGGETLVTHGLDAGLHAPLTPRLALSLRAGLASGDGLAQTRLYSALWYRL